MIAAERTQRAIVREWIGSGRASACAEERIFDRLPYTADLPSACRAVDLAIEAVSEKVDLKRSVIAQLDQLLPPAAIIATNSSSIRVSALESATKRPQRAGESALLPASLG